ncbi:hypothetical protein GYMLUDRAFT_247394 [Collybiopsis luxurians FD-317 M1]|uniref:Ribonuclease H1 N-terminal domain-containing protein n=1 Tax=Collybiopsis luxurians FD-317 M1 TaxID=944289 RepID=A0A0D0BP43_9AGAR|nr:hypothetical protein GYMLUDRAFT_247394 [Collybiopsis luxurians FD-317 M1]
MTIVNNPTIISALQAASAQSNTNCNALLAAITANQAKNPSLNVRLSTSTQGPQPPQASSNTSPNVCPTCVCPHGLSVEAAATMWYAVFIGRATGIFSSLPLVQALTSRMSSNTYHCFGTKIKAEAAYAEADRLGLVHSTN